MVPGPDQSFVSASHEHGGTFPGRSGREGLFRHLLLHSPFLPSGPLPSLRFNQRLPGIPRRSLVPHSQDREDHRYPHPREILPVPAGYLPTGDSCFFLGWWPSFQCTMALAGEPAPRGTAWEFSGAYLDQQEAALVGERGGCLCPAFQHDAPERCSAYQHLKRCASL